MILAGTEIAQPVVLAPLAGWTDTVFRQICKEFGVGLIFTEMASADAIVRNKGVRYAKYVQSAQYQTAQHRATGWMTDVQAVNNVERRGDVKRVTEQAARKEMGL